MHGVAANSDKGDMTMSNYRIQLPTHTLDSAPTAAKPLLDAAQKQMGMIPNLYGDMANVPGVLSTYLHGYERFRKATDLTPAEQEIVLLTVSYENGCHYCMAAHSSLAANRSKVPTDALQALRSGSAIEHPKLGALSRFTRCSWTNAGGRPRRTCISSSRPVTPSGTSST
jgi:AhpD family alkylhydroperoxidase